MILLFFKNESNLYITVKDWDSEEGRLNRLGLKKLLHYAMKDVNDSTLNPPRK